MSPTSERDMSSVVTGAPLNLDGLGGATSSDIWPDIQCPPRVDLPIDSTKCALPLAVVDALHAVERVRWLIQSETDFKEIGSAGELMIELHEGVELTIAALTSRIVSLTTDRLVAA